MAAKKMHVEQYWHGELYQVFPVERVTKTQIIIRYDEKAVGRFRSHSGLVDGAWLTKVGDHESFSTMFYRLKVEK